MTKILRYFFGFLFLITSLLKIYNINYFTGIVKSLEVLPIGLDLVFSFLIISLELLVSIFLFLNRFQKLSTYLVLTLTSIFLIISIYGYNFKTGQDCGCFGGIFISYFDLKMVYRNIFLFILSVYYLYKCLIQTSINGETNEKNN